jgi:phage gp46-like protein
MSDITLVWNSSTDTGDFEISGADLLTGNDLSTAILVSLLTDREARPDDKIPDGTTDPRGWWADDSSYPIGSRLWLLARAKQTAQTLASARDYIVEAVQWLIDDGVAASVDVYVEWTRRSMLGARISVNRTDGSTEAMNFAFAWKN